MKNRIRVGVFLFKDDKVLLIKHVNPQTGQTWWVPPGGGIQGAESIFDAAVREAKEEANLTIKPGPVRYARQFIYTEFDQNNADFYILGEIIDGQEHIENLRGMGGDEHFIKELKYFSQEEIAGITVFPSILRDIVWEDKRRGFPETRFLGVQGEGD